MLRHQDYLKIGELLPQALNHHRVGELERAIGLYREALRAVSDVHNNLGLALGDTGDFLGAVTQFGQALENDPARPDVWLNIGAVLQEWRREMEGVLDEAVVLSVNPNFAGDAANQDAVRGTMSWFGSVRSAMADVLRRVWGLADRPADGAADGKDDILFEAIACYRHALRLDPDFFQAYGNLGSALCEAGRLREAVEAFARAAALEPNEPAVHYLLGRVYQDLRDYARAIAAYKEAVRLDPGDAEAWCQLGDAHLYANELDAADEALNWALSLAPDLGSAQIVLAMLRVAQGRFEEAAATALAPVQSERDVGRAGGPETDRPQRLSVTKLRHDREQLDYLLNRGRIERRWAAVLPEYDRLLAAMDGRAYKGFEEVSPPASEDFHAAYRGLVHVAPAPALPGGALNPDLDVADLLARFRASDPAVVYFDDLLKPEAADALRRFCLDSTIWFNIRDAGDIGAAVGDGFACPLLFQVAQEIRETFAEILAPYPFASCWSYMYYEGRSGVNLHADEGAVSVNFWLTPDSANTGREDGNKSGGLKFWNKVCPPEYFQMSRVDKDRTLLEAIGGDDATLTTIPYAYNRAGLFQSNLIHSTDALDFAPGYENRRINVTLVYGRPQK